MNYEENVCPYDVGQLLTTKYVLQWALDNCPQIPNNNVCISNVFELLDNVILKEVSRQVHIARLEDYTTEELEEELKARKEISI